MSDSLSAWLEIESRILKAQEPSEAVFLAVNLAHAVVPYRQAAMWNREDGILALSGLAVVDPGSPFAQWLNSLFRHHHNGAGAPARLTAASLPPRMVEQWAEWLPIHVVVYSGRDEALLYARDETFSDDEIAVLERLADLVFLARKAMGGKIGRFRPMAKRKVWLALATLAVISMIPVSGSVLAPAQSVPAHPTLIRAPLDGVIDTIHVKPDDMVSTGQALFNLDATTLTGRLEVARQQHATALAEYRQAVQAMVFDARVKPQVAILDGKVQEKAAEVRLLENQLARIHVTSPMDGVAVFDDVADWLGRPVAVGEKIIVIADPQDTEIEAWVSVADIGAVKVGGQLTLFLNIAPLAPVKAKVRTVAYEATLRPDSTLAHRVRSTVSGGEEKPRLGLKGTARIDGDTVPLAWWLFRKPFSAIRQFIGF